MDCVFCKIVAGEIPSSKSYEDDMVVAFADIHPKALGHTLLVPKKHYPWFYDVPQELAAHWFGVAQTLAQKLKEERGADFVQVSIVGKDVPHAHIHLIPRKERDPLTV